MITAELIAGLRSILSDDQLELTNSQPHHLGNNGKIIVYPTTQQEIADVLKYANQNGFSINIVGGGTKRGFGGTEESADLLLSLSKYTGIVEHTVGDMTLTVKPGTPYQELQDYLAAYNQRIPLDPAWPELATIGGVIAANDSGPKRLGYGSARDLVIGLRTIYPDGTMVRSGGKTVKNVAGYDMNKLFIGSMGTLGVLSEITLKLRPLSKFESLILLAFQDSNLDDIRTFTINLLDSVMEPIALELLSPALSETLTGNRQFTLAISFEDVESSVIYQVDYVKSCQPLNSTLSVLEQNDAQAFWAKFANIGPNATVGNETNASLKVGVKNLNVLQIVREAHLLEDTENLVIEAHGGLGHGLCKVHLSGAADDVLSTILKIRAFSEKLGGYAVVTHLPFALRQEVEVWGEKPAHFFLLEGIKSKVDPNRILNRKRFVGGI